MNENIRLKCIEIVASEYSVGDLINRAKQLEDYIINGKSVIEPVNYQEEVLVDHNEPEKSQTDEQIINQALWDVIKNPNELRHPWVYDFMQKHSEKI